MDMELEREKLQEQCRRFSYYIGMLREDTGDPYLRTLQCAQNMQLVYLLAAIQRYAFDLQQDPEEAEEIGADLLELLYLFSEGYADMLEQEYQWCEGKHDPPEI